jgi:hypothetical protein
MFKVSILLVLLGAALLPSTSAQEMFRVDLMIRPEFRNYYGNAFPVSAPQLVLGEFFALSPLIGLNLELFLERNVSSNWVKVDSSLPNFKYGKVNVAV